MKGFCYLSLSTVYYLVLNTFCIYRCLLLEACLQLFFGIVYVCVDTHKDNLKTLM
jgi:hypothetical protein